MENSPFYTLRGYDLIEHTEISPAMEDYLEMICRYTRQRPEKWIRTNHLASMLHVRPSSVSKMAAKLKEKGLVTYTPYAIIMPTEKGDALGCWLLHRHEVLERFFCMVNGSKHEVKLVEKIEHFIDPMTLRNMEAMLAQHTESLP